MSAREIYYKLKPFIPRRMQIALRRRFALAKRERCQSVWPIDPICAERLSDWPGWPDGKRFGLVIAHDVDTQKGHDAALKLLEIEQALGFRSSFNFVPERYSLSLDLIREIQKRGFGIGVHGLKHDGKLFSSEKIFAERAIKINQYLELWQTKGFTAPSMIHNLEWMPALNIEYGTTTFDTDPFEPQPDGAGTVYPYWVNAECSPKSYVELPYTLPQDFTLYILFREKTTEIWEQKLEWLADCGGMALFNTHPDYMNFDNTKLQLEEYPVELYINFLQHIKSKYAGQYWNALPQEVSDYIHRQCPIKSNN